MTVRLYICPSVCPSTFSKAISSAIYNVGWQMTTDSYIRAQYLKLIGSRFCIFILVFVSRDFEVGSK